MGKIERYSNWCELDQLDGETIKDGETLEVTFPNGKVIKLKAAVESYSQSYNDHGHDYTMPVSHAYHKSWWAGVPVQVSLVGLEAKRIKGETHGKKEKEG